MDKVTTSEKLKARQFGAATLPWIVIAIALTIIDGIWGDCLLGSKGDKIPLGIVIFYVRNMVLLFGMIDLVSAIYHFVLWNRNGRICMDDDNNSLFSDWKSGERSPLKISLVLMAGVIALALLLVMQG